jgi:SsrA-binding protein
MSQKKENTQQGGIKIVTTNRKAHYNYEITDSIEAGIVLKGTEVKSLREGKANLQDSYARIKNGEVWVFNMHISQYDQGSIFNHEPTRNRKLLLHRNEILRLSRKVDEKGMTLVPLKVYFKNGKVKLEIGIARGKRKYEKKETIKKKDMERELRARMKEK